MLSFCQFFTPKALTFLDQNIELALAEDGPELTAEGIFKDSDTLQAKIVAKEASLVVGLPLIGLILKKLSKDFTWEPLIKEGEEVLAKTTLATISAQATVLLKAERIILNYLCHLSGIATLTKSYVEELNGTGVRLLDTRKTTPGLRWLEKYAVQRGGGTNHRLDLTQMLMLKDNHLDAVGSMKEAVKTLHSHYGSSCPPIEVECRTLDHVQEAISSGVERIMLDNMSAELLQIALPSIPKDIEVEVSGNVTKDNIRKIALISPRRPNFISVGRLTHSAKSADFSMTLS